MDDIQFGQIVADTFLNSYKKVNGFYISRDELMSRIYKYNPDLKFREWGKNFKISLGGNATRLMPLTDLLAEKTKGGLPSVDSISSLFYDALPTKFEIVTDAVTKSAEQVGEGLVAVGDSAIFTGKILTFLMPVIVIGGLGYFLYKNKNLLELKK